MKVDKARTIDARKAEKNYFIPRLVYYSRPPVLHIHADNWTIEDENGGLQA
jgi:tRNA(Phe) wybutosine-synthesizing methylase Tyw3